MIAVALAVVLAAGDGGGAAGRGPSAAGGADGGAAAGGSALTWTLGWSQAGHRGPVLALAISADGKKVATGAGDGVARIFSTADGKLLAELKGAKGPATAVAFSADGRRVAVGEANLAVRIYLAETHALEHAFPHPDGVSALAFSPDSALLAVAGVSGNGRIYTVADAKPGFDFTGRTAHFSADGSRLVAAVGAGAIRTFSVADGKQLAEIKTAPHLPWLQCDAKGALGLSWNPADKNLHLWDLASGKPLREIAAHEKGVAWATLSADGTRAFSASDDKTLRAWDTATGRAVGRLIIDLTAFVAAGPDGQTLAVTQGNKVLWYRLGR